MGQNSVGSVSVTGKIAKGGGILVLMRLIMRMIGLASTLILFRILVPDDFGLVSIAMSVIGLFEVLVDFGFDQALIRKQDAGRSDFDVTWTLAMLRGGGVALVLLVVAGPAAQFLKDARLAPMLYWLALVPLLNGLQNVGMVEFVKELQFDKELVFKVSQKLLAFGTTWAAALLLRNYWALVIGLVVSSFVGLFLSYLIHPYRPRFSLEGAKGVFKFSVWLMFNNVVLYAGNQTDKVLIQRQFEAKTVGVYRVAEEMSSIIMELVWPVERALYAGYSKMSNSTAALRSVMFKGLSMISLFSLPVSIGMMLVADPLVALLLGPKANGASDFMKVLVLHGAIRSCMVGVFPVFLAMGKPHLNAQVTVVTVVVRLVVLFLTFPLLGSMAAPWSLVVASCTGFVMLWWQARVFVQIAWMDFPAAIWRPVLAVIAMALLVPMAEYAVFGDFVPGNDWILLGFRVFTGAMVYVIVLLGLWMLSGMRDGPERVLLTIIRSRLTGTSSV